MPLRDYQERALDEIRQHYASGRKKVCLHMPTGSGKGYMLSHILASGASRGRRGLFVVRGRELVYQGSRRLHTDVEIPHGIIMAGEPQSDHLIQVCSISTLARRGVWPPADFVVIDECHQAAGDEYQALARAYPDAYFLGVTATPYAKKSIAHIAQHVVAPITYDELVAEGDLVPSRVFAPVDELDLSGLRKQAGDYHSGDSASLMMRSAIVGDTVTQYALFGDSRPAVAFCVNIAHAHALAARFNEAGLPAVALDESTKDDDRQAAIAASRRGDIRILCNVLVLSLGVDMPWISCVIMARPTMSEILHVQMQGRGSRPFPGKSDFIVIDQCRNVERLGFLEEPRQAKIEPPEKKKVTSLPVALHVRRCTKCGAYCRSCCASCPYCGNELTKPRSVVNAEGILREMERRNSDPDSRPIMWAARWQAQAKAKQYKDGWVYFRLKQKFGEQIAARVYRRIKRSSLPPRQRDPALPIDVS